MSAEHEEHTDDPALGDWGRLDVTTWTLHEQPPAEYTPSADRRARRLFVAHWVLQIAGSVFLLGAVFPALFFEVSTLPPVVLVLGTIGVVAGVVVTDRWHRRIRRGTGVPIAPELVELMGYTAEQVHSHQERFSLLPELEFSGWARHVKRVRARQLSRSGTRTMHQLGQALIPLAEKSAVAGPLRLDTSTGALPPPDRRRLPQTLPRPR